VWLLLLPFRLLGLAVEGVFELLRGIILLPARVLRGRPSRDDGELLQRARSLHENLAIARCARRSVVSPNGERELP